MLLVLGCVIFLSDVLREIPVAVLFGVFLYLGIISLFTGIQFMEQLRLFFTPRKYHPHKRYIYMVRKIFGVFCKLVQILTLCLHRQDDSSPIIQILALEFVIFLGLGY